MAKSSINTIEKDRLIGVISALEKRIKRLENLLQGVPIETVRIASLSVSKLTTGTMTAVATLGGGVGSGYVKIDGVNNEIAVNDGTNKRISIGKF